DWTSDVCSSDLHRHTKILAPTALGCRKSHFEKIPTTLGAMTDTPQKMNVESFNLDHRAVAAPFVRIADRKELPGGDVLVKYDVRFKQPNVEHLEMPTVHSLEHMLAEHLRNHTDALIDFSPMGCQTGFYALMLNVETEDFLEILEKGLNDVLNATEVPAANEVQCGWGESHSLEGAKEAARELLSKRDEWNQVMAA